MTKEDLRKKYERIHFEESDTAKGKLKQNYAKWLEKELIKQLTLTDVVKSFKDKKAPTFDEFITNFGLEADRDNEYFFDNNYYTFEGLYYKYAEYFELKP